MDKSIVIPEIVINCEVGFMVRRSTKTQHGDGHALESSYGRYGDGRGNGSNRNTRLILGYILPRGESNSIAGAYGLSFWGRNL